MIFEKREYRVHTHIYSTIVFFNIVELYIGHSVHKIKIFKEIKLLKTHYTDDNIMVIEIGAFQL